ncbi:MAG TPA: ATP-binding protein [Verrucomicrobiae bacterium]|jgi:signal transduction histidine kinase|nr:ATP-binding protein [Verrucomicrobiae bacterium]
MAVVARPVSQAELVVTVGILQEELEATNHEVLLLTLELEQRVAERTAELASANKNLIREISERVRGEAEIKKLNHDLERRAALLQAANEELEAFSSSVSHDLRNPLSRILGFASLLQDSDQKLSDEKPRRYIEKIGESVHKMSALIDDLLRLSYSSSAPLVLARVDMNQMISNVISDLSHDGHAENVKWHCGVLPVVQADPSLLRQAFVNLLSNAVKYSRGCAPPKVDISALEETAEDWTVLVRDNGVGFDSSKAEKLFGAFQRLHSTAEFEGTGIGLANVRRIVLRHGGKVWAESQPAQGATFFVSLPKNQGLADTSVPESS